MTQTPVRSCKLLTGIAWPVLHSATGILSAFCSSFLPTGSSLIRASAASPSGGIASVASQAVKTAGDNVLDWRCLQSAKLPHFEDRAMPGGIFDPKGRTRPASRSTSKSETLAAAHGKGAGNTSFEVQCTRGLPTNTHVSVHLTPLAIGGIAWSASESTLVASKHVRKKVSLPVLAGTSIPTCG
eukprot:CAMPEP_0178385886 /NCGR_PEP_ID=MMETSP0689_2-20121128/8262_1 /TAXON_ID=160604 /ORGANISM="Amphidinium massartii, Strain CS-259" /LENGTH=183 /DNA_ID=CAMNT_0020006179 /DNA_START=740 /DNA_END=1291 /DNA_ORIENTATION=-